MVVSSMSKHVSTVITRGFEHAHKCDPASFPERTSGLEADSQVQASSEFEY